VKRLLLIAGGALLLVLVLGGLVVLRALRAVGTPEFKGKVLAEARQALGTEVEVREMEVSLLRGFRLRGVRIANPSPFGGDLLTAEAFSLGYELWPLLFGRVQIDELSVDKPEVRLQADSRGNYNYERLKVYQAKGSAKPAASSAPGLLRELVVKRLAMRDGKLGFAEGKATFLRLEDLGFESRISLGPTGGGGEGRARVGLLALGESLFLREIEAPIAVSKGGLRLEPIRARLAGGTVEGKIRLDLEPALRWSLELDAGGASLQTLMKEAGMKPAASGQVAVKMTLSGAGGAATAKGRGKAEIGSCEVGDSAVLKILSGLLQLKELASPRFEDCRMEVEVGGGVARTTVLRLKGPSLELSGKGTYGLVTSALDYDMTLALSPGLVSKIPGNTTRAAFKKREDGFATLAFGVTGTAADPKVDLAKQLGFAVATEAVKEGAGKLFGKKRKPN
jgi:hypothetical protein